MSISKETGKASSGAKTPTQTGKPKPGRPAKAAPSNANTHASVPATETVTPSAPPPSIQFRSFKIALAALKDLGTMPDQLDRSVWTNKLVSTDRRETVEACRFLGLIDQNSRPTESLQALVAALDTDSWSAELRKVLERSYQPLLACSISALTAGGMMRTFRTLYRTPGESTRKSCNFFVHAAREAALEIGPFLLTNSRSRWVDGQRVDFKEGTSTRTNSSKLSVDAMNAESLSALVGKFPTYDAAWPDDVKRLWFSALNSLIQRLDADINPG